MLPQQALGKLLSSFAFIKYPFRGSGKTTFFRLFGELDQDILPETVARVYPLSKDPGKHVKFSLVSFFLEKFFFRKFGHFKEKKIKQRTKKNKQRKQKKRGKEKEEKIKFNKREKQYKGPRQEKTNFP